MPWQSPSISVKWGRFFKPDPAEEQQIVATCQEALGGKGGTPTITLRQAVEKQAAIFGTENVDAALEELEKERDERAQRELDATTAALDAEARAQRSVQNAKGGPSGTSGGGGRPKGG